MEQFPEYQRIVELGREEGRQVGREEGRQRALAELALRLLRRRSETEPQLAASLDDARPELLQRLVDALLDDVGDVALDALLAELS